MSVFACFPRSLTLVATVVLAWALTTPSPILTAQSARAKHHENVGSRTAASHAAPLTAQERTLQVLDRFTFGPRPQDPALVAAAGGPEAWFEQQLNPDSIDDSVLKKRLAQYPALGLPTDQLLYNFPPRRTIKQVADGKQQMPTDPMLAGLYQTLLYKYDAKREVKQANQTANRPAIAMAQPGAAAQPAAAQPAEMDMTDAQKAAKRKQDATDAERLAGPLLALPPQDRMAALLRLPVMDRITIAGGLQDPMKTELLTGMTPRERDLYTAMSGGPDASGAVKNQLQQAKVLRAILSNRQLQEVMTDFWFNHFNVFLNKEEDSYYTASYERDAIRAHALGKFRDLLLATAHHPAMLLYLDNWQSIGPDSVAGKRTNPKGVQRGLNENYGREVMELHTVGVNGGYTQADVTELSKILTGWTVDHPEDGGVFVFEPRRHEPGTKHWFGQTIQEGGEQEGVQALNWLASRPQTAHFISYELAQRFVADEPPQALVDRMTQAYLASDGDIKQVLRTMVHSPEFWQRQYYRNKVKTPLEFVASSFRATDTDPNNPGAITGLLARMGEPLYGMLPPTGYPMTADHWMNSAALVDRLNFALSLANGRFANMKFDAAHLVATGLLTRGIPPSEAAGSNSIARQVALRPASDMSQPSQPSMSAPADTPLGQEEALLLLQQMLTGGAVSEKTDSVIRQQLAQQPMDATAQLDTMAALILGSPQFQMR